MLFNSYLFIFLFLPVVLLGCYVLGKLARPHIVLLWLVGASLFFYGWWNSTYLALIVASIALNYSTGHWMRQKAVGTISRKWILIGGIAFNLLLLGYFKYANFFADSINALTGAELHLQQIILPLAISFFTFQQIAYLVDAYRAETKPHGFLNYSLFVTFFPQLIAGPIVHHQEMMPQFEQAHRFKILPQNLAIGLTIFAIGLFKKVMLADNISIYANLLFNGVEAGVQPTFFEAWFGTLAYTFQIYFDFSGYSDMAIGLARLFGIKLPLNFHSPYKAHNIAEFWRRWHMTLSRFLRDYVYIPLGGNRKGAPRRYLNLMLTMLLGGLWHGAGWTFVIWGGLHGVYLAINHGWQVFFRPQQHQRKWSRGLARLVTFLAVAVAWVFFRATSMEDALIIVSAMGQFDELSLPLMLRGRLFGLESILTQLGIAFEGRIYRDLVGDLRPGIPLLLSLWAIAWSWPNTQQLMRRYEPALDVYRFELPSVWWQRFQWQPTVAWALLIAVLAVWSLIGMNKVSEFLYFQF